MSFLYDSSGHRKYLTIAERQEFLEAASTLPPEVHTFCTTLAFTGARISEVLALTPDRFDIAEKSIQIECLKKRKRGIFRTVPVPNSLLALLDDVHGIRLARLEPVSARSQLWPWCRTTAWKHVKHTMRIAGILGQHANPKGLRHSFGVSALQKNVPINLVRKWLGHARLSTTAIYTDALGEEERAIAQQFWESF